MANCTGMRCPMQAGYRVDECDYKDCPWRTEQMTNADRIRAMSDEELGVFLAEWAEKPWAWKRDSEGECLAWLREPVKNDDGND